MSMPVLGSPSRSVRRPQSPFARHHSAASVTSTSRPLVLRQHLTNRAAVEAGRDDHEIQRTAGDPRPMKS